MESRLTKPYSGLPWTLVLGILVLTVIALVLGALYYPVVECPVCGGAGVVMSFSVSPGREMPCSDCAGKGKLSLYAKWRLKKTIHQSPPPP